MVRLGIQIMWLALYQYYIEQISELEKGYGKRAAVWGMTLGTVTAVNIVVRTGTVSGRTAGLWVMWGSWLAVTLVLFLYVLFYDGKPFRRQWWKVLLPGAVLSFCSLAQEYSAMVVSSGVALAVFLTLLAYERGYLRVWNGMLNLAVYLLLCLYAGWLDGGADGVVLGGVLLVELLLFLSLEGTLYSYHRGYENRSEQFQRNILSHQYEEIKEIYLNMRGWRHDYHNHLQVMKAQMWAGQIEEMGQYLDELEQNLGKVDTYVKSGNLMVDAVLNSKLTLAEQKGIRVNCKAVLPESLSIEDVDLCVLLGNLLDNALEACEKIEEEQRFLRIYMVVNGSQFYVSIQNSAKEELDFNERNYISTKRGNHGLGMKRVKALADKYEGYLTLANEPGIFAAEVTLPL